MHAPIYIDARRLTLLALLVCAAVVAAPMLGSPLLYWPFSFVCHQRQERSLWLAGLPLAVCARCLGIYFGALFGLLLAFPSRRKILLSALALLALDWLTETAGLRPAWTELRFASGFLLGMACAPVVREAVGEVWQECPSR